MEKDYSDLEGTEVIFIGTGYEGEIGIVSFIDYSVGITIINKENKDDKLLCLNGELSNNKDGANAHSKYYKAYFNMSVNMIRKNKFNANIARELIERKRGYKIPNNCGMSNCATGL